MAFLTHGHKLRGLKLQKWIPAQSGGQKSEIRVWVGLCPSGGSRADSLPPLPAPELLALHPSLHLHLASSLWLLFSIPGLSSSYKDALQGISDLPS